MRHGLFKIVRHGQKEEHQERRRKRSTSTPRDMNSLQASGVEGEPESTTGPQKTATKKKSSVLTRLWRKGNNETSHTDEANHEAEQMAEELQRKSELDFAHALMQNPAELAADLCRVDSEPELVQTICAPFNLSKDAIRADKKIHQIYVANNRIETLSSLSGTAVLKHDHLALNFLLDTMTRIRKQRATLFKQLDELLTKFKQDPSSIMAEQCLRSPYSAEKKVFFTITKDDDTDSEDLHWEVNSLSLSTENTSDEDADEGPTPKELQNIAKEIRKEEATRYKHKRRLGHWRKRDEEQQPQLQPPPPNPLGHTNRALMRTHTTVPSGLCQLVHSSTASLQSAAKESEKSQRVPKLSLNADLPFYLLSLGGQLSWLVSAYIERNSSTYRWATDLINHISRMSVTKSTWLNLHQQVRETTELLYKYGGRQQGSGAESAKGQAAWTHLQSTYESVKLKDSNSETVTVGRANQLLNNQTEKADKKLKHLTEVYNTKLHLAYICDLILWRAHKVLFSKLADHPEQMADLQLIDFRIRHMQLRLDQANMQTWSPSVIDWITRWIYTAVAPGRHVRQKEDDDYCLNELSTMRQSIRRFQVLIKHLCDSEFLSGEFLQDSKSEHASPSPEVHSHQYFQYNPYVHHHGESGHLQDLRPLNADRCSQTYSALIRAVHEHAMADRPLSYFAQRALYDISMELNCPVDWQKRLDEVLDELVDAYSAWEEMLMACLDLDFYQKLFEAKK